MVPIYPSQLGDFKLQSKQLAIAIRDAFNVKISAFLANDLLSHSLGYKGHADLIASTKFRLQSDSNDPLYLFNEMTSLGIAKVFSEKLKGLSYEGVLNVCRELYKRDLNTKHMIVTDNRPVDSGVFSGILLDEYANGQEETESRAMALRFITEMHEENAAKNLCPVLRFDFSEMPAHVFEALSNNKSFKDIYCYSGNVRVNNTGYLKLKHSPKEDWKFRVSLDIWGVSEVEMDLLVKWNAFKTWLLGFNVTNRVVFSERIKGASFVTYVTQSLNPINFKDVSDKFENASDKELFSLLTNTDFLLAPDVFDNAVAEHKQYLLDNPEKRVVSDDVITPFARAMKSIGFVAKIKENGMTISRKCPDEDCQSSYSSSYLKEGVGYWGCPRCKMISKSK